VRIDISKLICVIIFVYQFKGFCALCIW